jgi:carbamoyltransferase
MLICGLKLTHDGAVAVIRDGQLVCSVEMEKLGNGDRYKAITGSRQIEEVLGAFAIQPDDIDHFVVDGWGGYNASTMDVLDELAVGVDHNTLKFGEKGEEQFLGVRQYIERRRQDDILTETCFTGLRIGEKEYPYSSFLHVTGHIMGTYMASPFSARRESAAILVWDGGMFPQLYLFDGTLGKVSNLGPIFMLIGNIYTVFSQHFGPFDIGRTNALDNLSIAGKVMAYTAIGQLRRDLFELFDTLTAKPSSNPMGMGNLVAAGIKEQQSKLGISDDDVLTTFQAYLQERLITGLKRRMERLAAPPKNLCMAGGCALNVVWNRAIRSAGIFDEVFVPPFPNDSGSALGQACAKAFVQTGNPHLSWSVYAGPELKKGEMPDGWTQRRCTPEELARILHEQGEACVVLHGRAEIGPRALGNRSILAPASSLRIKDLLNQIKIREAYRPVAPICIEASAPTYFDPGTPDPYMVFNHELRPQWREDLAAIMHLDGSARLQTVSAEQNPIVHQILTAYGQLSGMPVLCNTSANLKGCGFFPDAGSAMRWGGTQLVWSEGILFENAASTASAGSPA